MKGSTRLKQFGSRKKPRKFYRFMRKFKKQQNEMFEKGQSVFHPENKMKFTMQIPVVR